MFKRIYDTFLKNDCDMIEINPMVLTNIGSVLAADAKITIDSNAEFRQKELVASEDKSQINKQELIAEKHDLNYIHIGGNIGCLVNGAGLAMSTMDIIKLYGGEPANFLDVGGGADVAQMTAALGLLNDDPNVTAIFVNIFGGILRCDLLAASILEAHNKIRSSKPMIVRLKGTKSDVARKMLALEAEELNIHFTEDFDTAAQNVVKKSKE